MVGYSAHTKLTGNSEPIRMASASAAPSIHLQPAIPRIESTAGWLLPLAAAAAVLLLVCVFDVQENPEIWTGVLGWSLCV